MEGAAVYTVALFAGGGVGREGVTPAQGGRTTPQPIIPGGGSGAGVLPHHKGPQGGEGSELTTRNPFLPADVREVEGRL